MKRSWSSIEAQEERHQFHPQTLHWLSGFTRFTRWTWSTPKRPLPPLLPTQRAHRFFEQTQKGTRNFCKMSTSTIIHGCYGGFCQNIYVCAQLFLHLFTPPYGLWIHILWVFEAAWRHFCRLFSPARMPSAKGLRSLHSHRKLQQPGFQGSSPSTQIGWFHGFTILMFILIVGLELIRSENMSFPTGNSCLKPNQQPLTEWDPWRLPNDEGWLAREAHIRLVAGYNINSIYIHHTGSKNQNFYCIFFLVYRVKVCHSPESDYQYNMNKNPPIKCRSQLCSFAAMKGSTRMVDLQRLHAMNWNSNLEVTCIKPWQTCDVPTDANDSHHWVLLGLGAAASSAYTAFHYDLHGLLEMSSLSTSSEDAPRSFGQSH